MKFVSFILGCCFVTFYCRKSAVDAQNALHNIKTLPGVSKSKILFDKKGYSFKKQGSQFEYLLY